VRAARWRWRLLVLGVVAVVVVLVVLGADRPPDPELGPPPPAGADGDDPGGADGGGAGPERLPIEGFDEIAFRLDREATMAATRCALLADDPDERRLGLMGQQDLRGYDAMVFRFDEPTDTTFTMRDTLIPLSIAFFDEEGQLVSTADMDPCPPGTEDCPSYEADGPFLHALEVARGGLPGIGVEPGARLSFPDAPCPG
jgi:uncharacterized membrane protein (UPF0127 family)